MRSEQKQHTLEFWNYFRGNAPWEVAVELSKEWSSLEAMTEERAFDDLEYVEDLGIPSDIRPDVERVWSEGVAKNPRLSNNPKPNLRTLSADGKQCRASFATYKTSFWIKNRLSEQPMEVQRAIANLFPFFNIGVVTRTSDDYLLLEQRPDGVTAPQMLLTYPCGYLTRGERTLGDTLNAQGKAELGFYPIVREGLLDRTKVRRVCALGMQRESDEWTPNYTFLMELNIPYADIRPTKETKKVIALHAGPELLDEVVRLYAPSIKGDVRGKLVPNATGMLALYIKEIFGNGVYQNFLDRITEAGKRQGHKVEVCEYTPRTNPFK